MPGRTPSEAFDAFVAPLAAATSCLGQAKIVPSPGARSNASGEHAWTLNGPLRGLVLPGGRCFKASMKFRYVEHEAGLKVSTLEYIYTYSVADVEIWSMHWHPVGSSPEARPHLHAAIGPDGSAKTHRPTGRMTYEDAIEWVIADKGVTPERSDWATVLANTKAVHMRFRTWDGDGPGDSGRR